MGAVTIDYPFIIGVDLALSFMLHVEICFLYIADKYRIYMAL